MRSRRFTLLAVFLDLGIDAVPEACVVRSEVGLRIGILFKERGHEAQVLPSREVLGRSRVLGQVGNRLADFSLPANDIEAVDAERSSRRPQKGGEDPQGRSLPRPIRA